MGNRRASRVRRGKSHSSWGLAQAFRGSLTYEVTASGAKRGFGLDSLIQFLYDRRSPEAFDVARLLGFAANALASERDKNQPPMHITNSLKSKLLNPDSIYST